MLTHLQESPENIVPGRYFVEQGNEEFKDQTVYQKINLLDIYKEIKVSDH